MAEARDVYGTVFKNGSASFLARLRGADGAAVKPSDIARIQYSVVLLDDREPDASTPVTGHTGVAVEVGDVLFAELKTDAAWSRDSLGYNFKHALDVAAHPAFPIAGRSCRVVYSLVPPAGPAILVRFRVHVI
jgi:hypothetical protein